jgi:hypothetical protein
MKFTASLAVPHFDLASYKAKSHEFLAWVLAQAAREWLHNTADTLPVYGGASKATFGPLASRVEYALSIPVVGPNTISIGTENGTMDFKTENGKYQFTYYTTLPHLIINENFNANTFLDPSGKPYFHLKNPGPYHFETRGAQAFTNYISILVMPSLKPYMTVKRITV